MSANVLEGGRLKLSKCTRCGSNELSPLSGQIVCLYCRSRYTAPADEMPRRETTIGVASDIQVLLGKCVSDPRNSRRYAGLILDIDPTNREALKYLM